MTGDTEIYVAEDRERPREWRVEYFDAEGGCYVATFSGPKAEARARDYGNDVGRGALKRYEAGGA